MARVKHQKKRWISIRKAIIIVAIAAVCAFLMELVQINTAPGYYHTVPTDEMVRDTRNVYPDCISGMIGYEKTDTGLVAVAGDPQLYLESIDFGEYAYVYFFFREATKSEEQVQIFYPAKGYIAEEDSVRDTIPVGSTFWVMWMTPGEYPYIRIDIDTDIAPISEIRVGNVDAVYVTEKSIIHPRRIAIVTFLLTAVLLWMSWIQAWQKFTATIRKAYRFIKENLKKCGLNTALFIGTTGITALLFWFLFYRIPGKTIAGPQIVFGILIGCCLASMVVFRKTLASQPEYIFLVLILSIGFLFTYYMPHNGAHNWDEEFHYREALTVSYVDELRLTDQDRMTLWARETAQYDINGGLKEYQDRQDAWNQHSVYLSPARNQNTAVSEMFNGIGLFIGRALGLRYYQTHFLGLFTGLLAYALAGFFAIRKLKSGKMLAAVILMIPEGVFLACNYNYDSYLTVFSMLGLCYYIAQWQNRGERMSLRDAVIMIGSITFGCVCKPVYLPLLFILFLMPKDKFAARKYRLMFWGAIVFAAVFLVFSYVAPMLRTSAGIGDTRGGEDVSGGGQISFILHNPLAFLRILWRFLIDEYLNPEKANFLFTFFAYDGLMPNQYVVLSLLLVVSFTDKNEYDLVFSESPWRRIWPIFVTLGTMILVVTSMYIAFTPVGYETINGAQYRYLIPLYFPFLFHLGSGLVQNKMNRAWYNGIVLSLAAYTCFANVFNAYIVHYF